MASKSPPPPPKNADADLIGAQVWKGNILFKTEHLRPSEPVDTNSGHGRSAHTDDGRVDVVRGCLPTLIQHRPYELLSAGPDKSMYLCSQYIRRHPKVKIYDYAYETLAVI